ncbi:Paired box protein Pax-6 [Ceratocystis platani]|uniref:Paired box protein Pax-6 n=1 Tax=Ceratocystis fimbriata f. sp. platani TaxID=88771 RepID=A0A0F8AYC8_CERFI|nr:Paired box protein Pax-6 [Ceratocystis platani]
MEFNNMHSGQQVPMFLPTNQPSLVQQRPPNSYLQSAQAPFLQTSQAQSQSQAFMQHPTAQNPLFQMSPSDIQFALASSNMASMSLPTGPSHFFNLPAATDAAHQNLMQQSAPMYRHLSEHTYTGAMTHGMPQTAETRPRFTKEEVERLEAMYQQDVKPSTEAKKHMAMELGVAIAKINNWFQNRRAKAKLEEKAEQSAAEQRRNSSGPSATPSAEPATTEVINEHFADGDAPLRPSAAAFPSIPSTFSSPEASSPTAQQPEASSPQIQTPQVSESQSVSPPLPQVQFQSEGQHFAFSPTTDGNTSVPQPMATESVRDTSVSLAVRRSRLRNSGSGSGGGSSSSSSQYSPGSGHDSNRVQMGPRIRVPSAVNARVKKNSVSSASGSSSSSMSNNYTIPQNMMLSVSVDSAPRSLNLTPQLNSPYTPIAPSSNAMIFPSPTSTMPRNSSFSFASATPTINQKFSPSMPHTPNSEGRMFGSTPVTPSYTDYVISEYLSSLNMPMAYSNNGEYTREMGELRNMATSTGAGTGAGVALNTGDAASSAIVDSAMNSGDMSPNTQNMPTYSAAMGTGVGLGVGTDMTSFGTDASVSMFAAPSIMQATSAPLSNATAAVGTAEQNVDFAMMNMAMGGANRNMVPFHA